MRSAYDLEARHQTSGWESPPTIATLKSIFNVPFDLVQVSPPPRVCSLGHWRESQQLCSLQGDNFSPFCRQWGCAAFLYNWNLKSESLIYFPATWCHSRARAHLRWWAEFNSAWNPRKAFVWLVPKVFSSDHWPPTTAAAANTSQKYSKLRDVVESTDCIKVIISIDCV